MTYLSLSLFFFKSAQKDFSNSVQIIAKYYLYLTHGNIYLAYRQLFELKFFSNWQSY